VGRMVEKIVAAALILLPAAAISAGATPVASPKAVPAATAPPAARNGKGVVRLEEIRITGSPEHPGVLFFLPRARFHLLPLRTEGDGAVPPPAGDRGKGAPAR
jgi:hypothetical protein